MITLLAAGGGTVEVLLNKFNVNWLWFSFQLINFFLVIIVLKKFAFTPIIAMLEQRKMRIADGESKLKRIEIQLAESEERTAAALEKANNDAKRLIEEAKTSAAALTEEKSQEAIARAQSILAKAEAAAQSERNQLIAELKQDFGRLVVNTTASVTGKVLTEEDNKRINDAALASMDA